MMVQIIIKITHRHVICVSLSVCLCPRRLRSRGSSFFSDCNEN